METTIQRCRIAGLIFTAAIYVTTFVIYKFRDALLIILVFSFILNLAALLSSLLPILGQCLYFYLMKSLFIPIFFGDWFQDIDQTWLTDFLFWFGLFCSVSYSVLIMAMAYHNHEEEDKPIWFYEDKYND